jgi:hypothetical protein
LERQRLRTTICKRREQKECASQIVPLDLQVRIAKLLIVIINDTAKKGEHACHVIINPHERKNLLEMGEAVNDGFGFDPLRPFYDPNGSRIGGKKVYNVAPEIVENPEKKQIEE